MKYIKLYESFETDIEDILLEITDLGYLVLVHHKNADMINDVSHIQIKKYQKFNKINYEEIKDCVLRLKEYLNNNRIQIECNIYYGSMYNIRWAPFDLSENNYPPNDLVSLTIYYKK